LLPQARYTHVNEGTPLDDVVITQTAREKSNRYLTPAQLRTTLREASGYVCRKTSPAHEGLYDDSKFIIRGTFSDTDLDIVFTVESDRVVVVTQMSQHSQSLRGRFYERIGTTAADAVARLSD
jgi:hypothetical protein